MKAADKKEKNIHHGHAIKRFRRTQGMKQETLAQLMGISQVMVSRYESKKEIEDEMLEQFGKALGVDPTLLKELEEDPVTMIVENNVFENNKDSTIAPTGYVAGDKVINHNPLDKIVDLFERLLEKEQEKIALLE